jgi:uncharacterized protein YchJ
MQLPNEEERKLLTREEPPTSEFEEVTEAPVIQPIQPIRRVGPKVGRNDPCNCGSGKKRKKCCTSPQCLNGT